MFKKVQEFSYRKCIHKSVAETEDGPVYLEQELDNVLIQNKNNVRDKNGLSTTSSSGFLLIYYYVGKTPSSGMIDKIKVDDKIEFDGYVDKVVTSVTEIDFRGISHLEVMFK